MLKEFIGHFFEANLSRLSTDWRLIKSLIKQEIQSRNFERAISLLEKAGHLAYTYNFVPDYWDLEIEQCIRNVTKALLPDKVVLDVTNTNRIVFFDHFVLENRGFTQQYLNVLIEAEVDLLYIIDDPKKYNKQNQIIQLIEAYPKASITILKASTRVDKLKELFGAVIAFSPSKVFIHTAPWEIFSSCLAYALQNSSIKCYLLNITDHAFWPGITCFEYIIDWRSFGHNVNKVLKGKPEDKLIVVPTPGHYDESVPFQGFPAIPTGKVIGFSGGSYYKIVDKENTFLHLIKDVLDQNENFIFLFATIGGDVHLKQFISMHNLEDRFILLGNRKDITEVFKRIDIYFNTYPYAGGLMMQYAMAYNKPIISLANRGFHNSRTDLAFDCNLSEEHIIYDRNNYIQIASRLINELPYRKSYIAYYSEVKNVINDFSERVKRILNDQDVAHDFISEFEIDQKAVTDFHIEGENIRKKIYITRIYNIFHYRPRLERLGISTRYLLYRIVKRLNVI